MAKRIAQTAHSLPNLDCYSGMQKVCTRSKSLIQYATLH